MEDAMVLNKASVERGFAHGSVYRGRVGNIIFTFVKTVTVNVFVFWCFFKG